MRQAGLFGPSVQLKRLSDIGDPLETLGRVVGSEAFRPAWERCERTTEVRPRMAYIR
jgi:hypothetical protein